MVTMTFYVQRTPDGNYHVQNAVSSLLGQHHVHTPESFEQWRKLTDEVTMLKDGLCGCGLEAGQVREHRGKVWHNPRFAIQGKPA